MGTDDSLEKKIVIFRYASGMKKTEAESITFKLQEALDKVFGKDNAVVVMMPEDCSVETLT